MNSNLPARNLGLFYVQKRFKPINLRNRATCQHNTIRNLKKFDNASLIPLQTYKIGSLTDIKIKFINYCNNLSQRYIKLLLFSNRVLISQYFLLKTIAISILLYITYKCIVK